MKRIIAIAFALVSVSAFAEIKLPSVISDNMVIQRNTDAALWGWADPGKKVTVTPSWSKKKVTATADAQTGKWMVRVATPDAGGPYEIKISDGKTVTLKNVLSGDVWFCSGQSNMEMPMRGYGSQPAEGAGEIIAKAKASRQIRICNIQRKSSPEVLENSIGSWQENTPEAVSKVSATAYFFADLLQGCIDIPVGILVNCWGGSTIETWMRRDLLEKEFPGEFSMKHLEPGAPVNPDDHQSPSLLYNGQISPVIPFTFKGMIWYQGCSNRSRPEQYTRLQTAFVKMMRETFEVPDAPFYFVQIAPFHYSMPYSFDSGFFYEAQQKTLETIPNSGMATTCDAGEYGTIHPRNKKAVGTRLAYLALQHTYGQKAIKGDAPTFKSAEFIDGKAVVTCNVDDLNLAPLSTCLKGFELAGADRVFHPAIGAIGMKGYSNKQIVVTSTDVPEPVAVRYCFRNWSVGSVYNNFYVPLAPFRSDNWDDVRK